MDNRIFLHETDIYRAACENRARRAFWALYATILVMGLAFIIGFLGKLS